MKFTEGYWLRSEMANAQYASQVYSVEILPDRLRIVAPLRPVASRGDTLNVGTITTEFTSVNKTTIGVRSWHHEGYINNEPRFELHTDPAPVEITESDDEVVMTAGEVTVRVSKKEWRYCFEAGGRVLTGCGFRNLGYMRWGREPGSMLPQENYLLENGKPYMVTELSLGVGEYVYGLGERFTAFPKNGQVIDIWNEDGGTSSQISYKNIPFYLTNKGYGVFVDHTTPVSFEVASEKVGYVGFSVPGEELRYHLIYGETPAQILQGYTDITGRPALPPAWSFGLWLSTSFTTSYDEATTTSFIEGMAERGISLRVFHYDCFWMKGMHWCDFEWDSETFPDVDGMIARNKKSGLNLCVWINPYVAQGTQFFREGCEKGYLLKRSDGKGIRQLDLWQPGMGIVDFTNPGAAQWFADKLRGLLRVGIDCFKTDFGERIPIDVVYHNGADPVGMHNYYTYLYNKCVFDTLQEERVKNQTVLFARSATAGSQKFPVHWGGDNSASYPSMAETLRGGLSFALSGFSFWSHDIGGFENDAPADLYKRWVAFGLLSTHSRLHGSTAYRVPWHFDEEASNVLRYFVNLKCRLMPYIYSQAVFAHNTGVPVMRPMVLEFCGDPAVDTLDRQYMLGESLLVAPVMNEDGSADYYLPEGEWTHLLTGEVRTGGRWYTNRYDYFSLPLYVRPSTLLAWGGNDQRPDYDYTDGLDLRLYALRDGAVTRCAVPDLDGNTALEVSAIREGNRLEFTLSASLKGVLTLVDIDMDKVAAVEGGSPASGKDGVKIIPHTGSTAITVMLAKTTL